MSLTKLFGKDAEKISGSKKSTAAKKVDFVLPEERIQPEDVDPVFMDIGRVLVTLDFVNLQKQNFVDLDDAYSRFTPKQITEALANYYYDLIEMPSDPTEQTRMAIDSHNAQMLENRKAFLGWEPTITKWLKKYSAPFFKKKAFLVEIPVMTLNLTDLKAQFADKIGGGLDTFETNLSNECERSQLNQFSILNMWNDQHQLGISMNHFYFVGTQTKTKTSIPLKWMIFTRAEGENFPSRFVNVFTDTSGVDLDHYGKVLDIKHAQLGNTPANPYYGYLIASDIKANGKYWNIDGFCALWV